MPTHNWLILVGDIEAVDAIVYVAAAGAAIADVE